MEYYNREGEVISADQWGELLGDMEYKRVLETQIGPYWVSTVWIGLDYNWGEGPPLIFETMVFATDSTDPERDTLGPDMDCRRWSTEQEARRGHEEFCILIRATYLDESPLSEPFEESNGSEM